MAQGYSTGEIRALAKTSIEMLEDGKEDEFFRITDELLRNKIPFRLLYVYGSELGKKGVTDSEQYLTVLDKLFKKSVDYGCNREHFRANPKFWTEENIKAMVFGARIGIIATAFGVMGEKYPKKIMPIIKEYLIAGDGWYISDGLSIATGKILIAHFEDTLPILKSWANAENRWLRRTAAVSLRELLKIPGQQPRLKRVLVLLDRLMKEPDRLVKMGVSWMLREMTKHYKKEMLTLLKKWEKEDNKHTVWIVKNGIKKLPEKQQVEILKWFI